MVAELYQYVINFVKAVSENYCVINYIILGNSFHIYHNLKVKKAKSLLSTTRPLI